MDSMRFFSIIEDFSSFPIGAIHLGVKRGVHVKVNEFKLINIAAKAPLWHFCLPQAMETAAVTGYNGRGPRLVLV